MFDEIKEDSVLYIYEDMGVKDRIGVWILRHMFLSGKMKDVDKKMANKIDDIRCVISDYMEDVLDVLVVTDPNVIECWSITIAGNHDSTKEDVLSVADQIKDSIEKQIPLDPIDLLQNSIQRQIMEDLQVNDFNIRQFTMSTTDWQIVHNCDRDECMRMIFHCQSKYQYFLDEGFFKISKTFMEHQFKEFFDIPNVLMYCTENDLKSHVPNVALSKLLGDEHCDEATNNMS